MIKRKICLGGLIFILILILAGCGKTRPQEEKTEEGAVEDSQEDIARRILQIALEVHPKSGGAEVKAEDVLGALGEKGYVAVDVQNNFNMVNYEKAEAFLDSLNRQEQDSMELLRIAEDGGMTLYLLASQEGKLLVENCSLWWEGEEWKTGYYEKYPAVSWSYTDKGYFFFEQYRMEGYDGIPGQVAVRVLPLDDRLRQYNRRYVRPVGYERNKMLIANWNQEDYCELDLYDMYEAFCLEKYGHFYPEDPGEVQNTFDVPAETFEDILSTHLEISPEVLREKTLYDEASGTYRYRQRGVRDFEMPFVPMPEVTACREGEKGELVLTVEAVWEKEAMDRAFVSELTVIPREQGGYTYVSNRVIEGEGVVPPEWYKERESFTE